MVPGVLYIGFFKDQMIIHPKSTLQYSLKAFDGRPRNGECQPLSNPWSVRKIEYQTTIQFDLETILTEGDILNHCTQHSRRLSPSPKPVDQQLHGLPDVVRVVTPDRIAISSAIHFQHPGSGFHLIRWLI